MGVEQVQNQCKVTLEIPEARIEEWGLVRHNLYKYFGAKLVVSDKPGEGTVKITCTYTQMDVDIDKYRDAQEYILATVTEIVRIEGQEEMDFGDAEKKASPLPLASADDDRGPEPLDPDSATTVIQAAMDAGKE